jgi:hypothetical protein
MDPTETLVKAEDALASSDIAECAELLEKYREWRARGGFQPLFTTVMGVDFQGNKVPDLVIGGDEYAAGLQERVDEAQDSAEGLE